VAENAFTAGDSQAFGSFGRIGGDGYAATPNRSRGGFILGLDALALEAGFDRRLTPTATIGAFHSGALAARDEDNAVKGRFEVAF
jgi:uncharacterized protein with beta-barrel porin domain